MKNREFSTIGDITHLAHSLNAAKNRFRIPLPGNAILKCLIISDDSMAKRRPQRDESLLEKSNYSTSSTMNKNYNSEKSDFIPILQ